MRKDNGNTNATKWRERSWSSMCTCNVKITNSKEERIKKKSKWHVEGCSSEHVKKYSGCIYLFLTPPTYSLLSRKKKNSVKMYFSAQNREFGYTGCLKKVDTFE